MEDLKAYLDGELSPARRREIESAMEQDPQLKQEMEEIRVLSRLIGDCVIEAEPVGLESTLQVLSSAKPTPVWLRPFREPLRFGWVWTMACFAILAMALPLIRPKAELDDSSTASATALMDSAKNKAGAASTPEANLPPRDLGVNGLQSQTEMFQDTRKSTTHIPGGGGGFGGGAGSGNIYSLRGGPIGGEATGTVGGASANSVIGTSDPTLRASRKGVLVEPGGEAAKSSAGIYLETQGSHSEQSAEPKGSTKPAPAFAVQPPMLVRTAELSLRVQNVKRAQATATNTAKSFGGYVEQSSGNSDENSIPTAELTIRVPVQRFEASMDALRQLGTSISESMTGQDVTAQVADTEARLRSLKAEEISYLGMLKGTKHVDDTLAVRDRLDTVQQSIASLEAQDKALRDQSAYSTITLSLTEAFTPPKPIIKAEPTWFQTAWGEASDRASGLGRWFAEVGMNLLLLAPVWVPVVGLFWWLGRRRAG